MFGVHPATVYENIHNFVKYPEKLNVIMEGDVLDERLVKSLLQQLLTDG